MMQKLLTSLGAASLSLGCPGAQLVFAQSESGAFVVQIGDENTAAATQSTNTQFIRIEQDGSGNFSENLQLDDGAHHAVVMQTGDHNLADIVQSGSAAQSALLQQSGNGNLIRASQMGDSAASEIAASQYGDANSMSISQYGDDNHLELTQRGSGNDMTAHQFGDHNRLVWTQSGDNLSDLLITQNGSHIMEVTQTR